LTDAMDFIPPNDRRKDEIAFAMERMEGELVPLLTQTNQLLREILQSLRAGLPTSAARPTGEVMPVSDWLSRWAEVVNRTFELESPRDVREAIQTALAQYGEKPLIIDFDDVGEYQRDRNYALFSLSGSGCCFALPFPDAKDEYAVFPYPSSDTWFLQGKAVIKALYQVMGTDDAYAPKLNVLRPATLRMTDAVNPRGNPIFKPLDKGKMIAQ
jgi:hypothetical protein